MNPKGNPNIRDIGLETRFSSGSPAAIEAGTKGALAGHENERRRKTFREIASVYGVMPSDELEGKTNDEAVIVALYRKAKAGNVQAIDKLLNLFGEMVLKGELQLSPMEGMARMREYRENQSKGDERR